MVANTAQGSTVPELVQYMSREGLTFAAATSGDETAYTSLYRAMADYDTLVGQRTMTAAALRCGTSSTLRGR